MSYRARGQSSLGVLLATSALFALCFWLILSLLDVMFGANLFTALKANIDNAVIITALWTVVMLFLRRRRA